MTSKHRALVRPAILVVALAVRRAHFFAITYQPFFSQLALDSQEYDRRAQEIAKGQWLGTEVFFQLNAIGETGSPGSWRGATSRTR